MPQALVTINGVPGSNTNLPINVLVQLDNQNIGGEITYKWEILDQPPGPADTLSSTTVQNPTFTPKKEGSYLLRLTVNESLPSEQIDSVIAAILQFKTRKRVPAAGETSQADAIDGWATDVNDYLRAIDSQLADPGVVVGVNASGGVLTRGTILRVTSGQIIKAGLPGQEVVPGFVAAPATSLGAVDELLCVLEGGVDGSPSPIAGAIVKARYLGRLASIPLGAGAVGDTVFVSDTAQISLSPGTVRRQVGSIMSISGVNRDIWWDGVGGASITPIDAPYVVYGVPGILSAANRIDGINATGASGGVPYTFKAADVSTIASVFQRFSAAGADITQWRDETSGVLAKVDAAGNAVFNAGGMSVGYNVTPSSPGALLLSRGLSVGFSSNPALYQVLVRDANFGLDFTGTDPFVAFDVGDSLTYTRASNVFQWSIGSSAAMTLSGTAELTLLGATPTISFSSSANQLVWDGTNLIWNAGSVERARWTDSLLNIGGVGTLTSGGPERLWLISTAAGSGDISHFENVSSALTFKSIRFRRARGTLGARSLVNVNNILGSMVFEGYDGSVYRPAVQIDVAAEVTPAAGDMPGRIVFSTTPDASVTPVERLRIDSTGLTTITAGSGRGLLVVGGANDVALEIIANSTVAGTGGISVTSTSHNNINAVDVIASGSNIVGIRSVISAATGTAIYASASGSGSLIAVEGACANGYGGSFQTTVGEAVRAESSNTGTCLHVVPSGGTTGKPVVIDPSNTPASPVVGTLYVSNSDNKLYYYDGTTWYDLTL